MTWLPSALLFAMFGFVATIAAVGLVAAMVMQAAARQLRRLGEALGRFGFRRRVLAPLLGVPWPKSESLPKRIPAPPRMTPRPDLDVTHAALAAQVQRLNGAIDEALTGKPLPAVPLPKPKRSEIRRLIKDATKACRNAANHTS